MIKKLTINTAFNNKKGATRANPYSWAKDVPFLQVFPEVEFTEGLNIIFGPNGSGKSTVTGLCAFLTAAEQGGISTVTESWVRKAIGELPATLEHDGLAVSYLNPRNNIGLIGGALDDDFLIQGVENTLGTHRSTGQITMGKMNQALACLLDMPRDDNGKPHQLPQHIDWNFNKDNNGEWCCNHIWQGYLNQVECLLMATCEAGPRTFLMDEPESGFSLVWQNRFWRQVMRNPTINNKQVIVATHSPFALNIPGANYIETDPGYMDACLNLLKAL